MHTAVVVGIGSGEQSRRAAVVAERVITIGFPGEDPEGLPGHKFMVAESAHAGEVVSGVFGRHADIVNLADTQFFDQHPIAEGHVRLRQVFCAEFYSLLSRRPLELGDDVIDGLQGAFHLAHNAKYLLPAPMPCELPKLDCPAIAIAAGPSLNRHVDTLRRLQDRCLLVSCDSSVGGLLQHGVIPHVVTPHERLEEVKTGYFPLDHYPGIFCGNPAVHQGIPPVFQRHIYLPGTDLLYLWAEAPEDRLHWFGQSTGTLAVCAAMNLTTGPIYLVGHDLAYAGDRSHWNDVAKIVLLDEHDPPFEVAGYSGPVKTQYWWDVFRREIEGFARRHGNIVNTNAPDGIGAIIRNTLSGSLPRPEELPLLRLPEFPEPNSERLKIFRKKVFALPSDAKSLLAKLSSMQRPAQADMDLLVLCPGPNRPLFSYILRSVLGQFSMELRQRRQSVVIDGMVEAMRNSIRGCMGIFEEMALCV